MRLSARSAAAASLGRPVRHLDVAVGTGYLDVQLQLLREGHVLWLDFAGETARSAAYQLAMEQAAARGARLWDDDACGKGPAAGAKLRMWINYDADGDDAKNLNGEYVRILNEGGTAVSLAGWRVRDASHTASFAFPRGAVVPAGRSVTVHTGTGRASGTDFYRGLKVQQYGVPGVNGVRGDGAFLGDPHGDLRSHVTYPCVLSCTDPVAGRLRLAVQADAPGADERDVNGEFTDLLSTASSRIDISYRVLQLGGQIMELPRGSYLDPGERLRIHSGTGTADRTTRYWGSATPLLANGGGVLSLRTTQGARLVCGAWGSGRC